MTHWRPRVVPCIVIHVFRLVTILVITGSHFSLSLLVVLIWHTTYFNLSTFFSLSSSWADIIQSPSSFIWSRALLTAKCTYGVAVCVHVGTQLCGPKRWWNVGAMCGRIRGRNTSNCCYGNKRTWCGVWEHLLISVGVRTQVSHTTCSWRVNIFFIWPSEDRASWYILIIKPTRCTNFSNLFLE